ncbi:unnamed protein product, partial [Mesorhabditis belari]|uniref:Uncharacterized protein n=1 Tax=Mesorhabditis belari TaxID=2138241 RepID=A0AAF3F4D4_9BILA
MMLSFFNRCILFATLFFTTAVLAEGDSPWDGDGVTPECNGFHPPANPKEAALFLITDHSLQQHKVSRVQYLYRAIACEFPPQVQVKIANVNGNGVAMWTHWMEAREVRQALRKNDTSGNASISPCARISSIPHSSFDASRSNSTEPIPIHVLIVVDEEDFVKYPECDLRQTFQQLAKSSPLADPSLLHLDVIGVGKDLNVPALRVHIPRWENIDTSSLKIGYAGQEQNVRSVFLFGHIMQQYAQLINSILTQDIKNDVVDVVEKNPRDLQNQLSDLNLTASVQKPFVEVSDDQEERLLDLKPPAAEPDSEVIAEEDSIQLIALNSTVNQTFGNVERMILENIGLNATQLSTTNRRIDTGIIGAPRLRVVSDDAIEKKYPKGIFGSPRSEVVSEDAVEIKNPKEAMGSPQSEVISKDAVEMKHPNETFGAPRSEVISEDAVEMKNTKEPKEAVWAEEIDTSVEQKPNVIPLRPKSKYNNVTLDTEVRALPKEVTEGKHNWLKDGGWKFVMGLGTLLVVLCFLVIVLCFIGFLFSLSSRRAKEEDREKLLKANGKSTRSTEKKLSARKRQDPYSPVTYGEVGSDEVPDIEATAPVSMTRLEIAHQRPRLAKPPPRSNEMILRVEKDEQLIF